MKRDRTRGSSLRPTSCRYAMVFPRCEGIQYSRGSCLNPDVGHDNEIMKALYSIVVAVLLGYSAAAASVTIINDSISREDLPAGGSYVTNPVRTTVIYYVAGGGDTDSRQDRQAGLYGSTNSGMSWTHLTSTLVPTRLFVHPITEQLYAVLDYSPIESDQTGRLIRSWRHSLIQSDDGRSWKNISGPKGRMNYIENIFPDPDFSNRVCISVASIRPCVLQATDDQYTDWKWYKAWEWKKRVANKALQAIGTKVPQPEP